MYDLSVFQQNAQASLAASIRGIINLPTGTGKTLIQSRDIVQRITINPGTTGVYVILSPRILLSNQLMRSVRQDLSVNGTEAQYLVVHSGRVDDNDDLQLEKAMGITFREVLCGTTKSVVREAYDRAVAEKVSLVITGTYHSADRIKDANIPVDVVYCDEAHFLVQEQFSWIVSEPFPSTRAYFFTATLRETPSTAGMGMNNETLFGPVLYQEKPITMILAGEMVRPRIHMVDMSHDPQNDEADGLAVVEAFEEHRSTLNIGAKLLVVAKDGSTHLNNLSTHKKIKELVEIRPALTIFDISSKYGNRINGVNHSRDVFLKKLQNLGELEEAIIIHCDILAEGIDVPGITGVMPLISQTKSKFLQTLGRSTRLHKKDRSRLYNGELLPTEIKRFIKPYAWLIIPVYGEIGEDLRSDMKEKIRELRDHGFNPAEDIVVRQKRGKRQLTPISLVNEPTDIMTRMVNFTATVLHEIEDEEEANALSNNISNFNLLSIEEQTKRLAVVDIFSF